MHSIHQDKIREAVRLFLEGIGEDIHREGLLETPDRIARMSEELFAGVGHDAGENLQKMFYNLPLLTVSRTGLILMLVAGSAAMAIPYLPSWLGAVICMLILAFNAIAVIKAAWAADTAEKVDEKVKLQMAFIKNLTVEAESILARAKSEPVKAECKKVYEAVRYSDPMSNETLSVIEAKITVKVDEFATAVGADDAEKAKEIADDIIILVGDRNKKCKALE